MCRAVSVVVTGGLREGGGGGARLELITTFMVSEPKFEPGSVSVSRVLKCITLSLTLENVMKGSDRS